MRLARYDDAIASYDAALHLNPLDLISLYGRGIRGHADINEATELWYEVADQFAHYGVQL